MPDLYNLIFFPTVKQDQDEDEVKAKLASTLKLDIEKVDAWFATGKPTVLLKEVAADVADRYMQAILRCGGNCNMQPSGGQSASGLSLVPKPAQMDLFVCPACDYEEEVAPGTSHKKCPECGVVVEKWQERQEEERKKEEIRRRLLREARHEDDSKSDEQRKKEELEYLRKLEKEIMRELGLKPPSKIWLIFSAHPISLSISIGILLVTLSSALSFYVNSYLDEQAQASLVASPPGEVVQQMAPVVANAKAMQLSGNQSTLAELASTTNQIQGKEAVNQQLIKAAEQMMKGAGASAFLKAGAADRLSATTPDAIDEPAPVPVNRDTIGGIQDLPVNRYLDPVQFETVSQNAESHGQDKISEVLTRKIHLPDPENPNGADLVVDQIEKLDGSMVVNLLKNLSQDLEWDQFLLSQVRSFAQDGLLEQARELGSRIEIPRLNVQANLAIIARKVDRDPDADIKHETDRIAARLRQISSIDARAKTWLQLSEQLADAGVIDEPNQMRTKVEAMLADSKDAVDRVVIASRLAVAYLDDRQHAHQLFNQARTEAGRIKDLTSRVDAFCIIAKRYYDARNITLAGEILREAQILAATNLNLRERGPVFAKIAEAQLYMGDMTGALQSIDNAGAGEAKQKLLYQLGLGLVSDNQRFQAQALMAEMSYDPAIYRLAIRLISQRVNQGENRQAEALMKEYSPFASRLTDPGERAFILGQFARLHLRLGDESSARKLFSAAIEVTNQLSGRKASVSRGLIAVDQMRGLWVKQSKETMELIDEAIVKEALESELLSSERIIKNLLPTEMRNRAVASR